MAITISGENNNDRILAQDGVIDQISGINIVGLITASHINVGSNIQLGNAGIVTATTFVGNLTGNVNSTSPLLLQTGGSERFRITGNNELGIAGANYGSSGQVLTSGGSGSAVSWTTIPTQVTITNNADNRVITGGSGTNLNGESTLNYGSGHQLIFSGSATPLSGTSLPYSVNIYRDGGSGYGYFDTMTNSSYSTGVRIRTYNNTTYNNVIEHTTSKVTNFQTNGLTRLSITSGGQVQIPGGSTPFKVTHTGADCAQFHRGSRYLGINADWGGNTGDSVITVSDNFVVHTGGSNERLRINSSGVVQIDQGTAGGNHFKIVNDEISLLAGVNGTGDTYAREAFFGTTRVDSGSLPFLRIAGQGGIKFCVDANNERLRIVSTGQVQLNGATGKSTSGTSATDLLLANGAAIRFRRANDSNWINTIGIDSSDNLKLGWGGSVDEIHFGIAGIGQQMTLDSSGRLLLGTTTEGHNNAENLTVSASGAAGITIRSTGNNCHLYFSDATSGAGEYVGQIAYNHSSDYMNFITNGSERLRIAAAGQIQIGNNEDPANYNGSADDIMLGSHSGSHGMTILSATNGGGYIMFSDNNGGGSNAYRGQIEYQHNGDHMRFITATQERLRIAANGNIGVGDFSSVSPSQKLSVFGNMYMRQGDYITWNNGDCDIGGISGYHIRFRTYTGSSMTEKMQITSKGIITTPIGPLNYNSATAAAIVNTSGRQLDNGNDFSTNYKQNLNVGWYTIATNTGGRAWGKIGIRETYSSRHQAVTIFAGHHYGGGSDQNSLHTISSGRHSGNPLGAVRIKAYGTYDGAMLQVYLRDANNGVQAYLLGDNIQTHGWKMKDWIADGTDPGDVGNWSAINSNGGSSAYADLNNTQAGGTTTDGHIIPGRDNATDLGTPSYRFDDVFATNTTIQGSSDERLKQDIAALTTAEMNAAKRMSALFKTYRWKDRVLEKGDKARTHTGVIAQQVKAALEAEGLDPTKYGFYGFDEWYEDSEGTKLPIDAPTRQNDPVGINTNASLGGSIVVPDGFEKKSLYSIRIGELLAFIAAYNEQRFTSIESRLATLESS